MNDLLSAVPPKLFTETEVAALLQLANKNAVRRLRREGRLGFFRLSPKDIRIGQDHIAEFLRASEVAARSLTNAGAGCTLPDGNARPGQEGR